MEYLTCKEDDTLYSILRLFLALIAKSETLGKSETIAKQISEENNNEAVRSLLNILKGPDIPMTKFSLSVTYYALQILRQLIQFSIKAKILFMEDARAVDEVINLIKCDNLHNIQNET